MQEFLIPAGQIIFRENDVADCAYLVEEGWVEIQAKYGSGVHPLSLIGPGEIFGEMGLIDGSPRVAGAVAKENCRLLRVSLEQFNALLGRAEPFHAELLGKMVVRFRAAQKAFLNGAAQTRTETSELGPGYAMLARYRDIANALERGEIEPFFQPIIDMTSGRWRGFEALVRWRCPQAGMIMPSSFLPAAERTGLIRRIDFAVAERSLALCQTIAGERRPYLNLNFSAWHFRDDNLIRRLAALLETNAVDPCRVRVELTETLMLDDPDNALRIMTGLAEMGVKLALDDFGTGFSSLNVLHKMPIDVLKIDRSLVLGVLGAGRPRTVLKNVVALAGDLGMEIVCEGIEDQVTANALLELGCTIGQGYHFARPMPAAEAVAAWAAHCTGVIPAPTP